MSRVRRVLTGSRIRRGQWVTVQGRQMTAGARGEPDLRVPKRNKLSRAKRDKRGARGSRSAIESISRS